MTRPLPDQQLQPTVVPPSCFKFSCYSNTFHNLDDLLQTEHHGKLAPVPTPTLTRSLALSLSPPPFQPLDAPAARCLEKTHTQQLGGAALSPY